MEENNWDLQAVVRGCGGGGPPTAERDPFSSFLEEDGATIAAEDDLLLRFPDLFSTRPAVEELEDLYKPFFSKSPPLPISPPPPQPSSSYATPILLPRGGRGGGRVVQQVEFQQPRAAAVQQQRQTPRSKRMKNQQKRVVCQVPADGLSSDMWAWRKYGQKPIKGSPYPRGYYRCSTSKGCLARKMVERSRTDPTSVVITYTAEHNHPIPIHRNSLAGSTRNKFPPSSSSTTTTSSSPQLKNAESGPVSSPSPTAVVFSPPTPLVEQAEGKKEEGGEDDGGEEDDDDEDEGVLLVSDMEMLGEDDVLFMGLDQPSSTGAATDAATAEGLPEQFSSPPWTADNTARHAAAAHEGL